MGLKEKISSSQGKNRFFIKLYKDESLYIERMLFDTDKYSFKGKTIDSSLLINIKNRARLLVRKKYQDTKYIIIGIRRIDKLTTKDTLILAAEITKTEKGNTFSWVELKSI